MTGTQKKACFVLARGCTRTQIDLCKLEAYFRANGWDTTDNIGEADVVGINTCAFTGDEENMSRSYLHSVRKEMKQGARLVVTGCLTGIDPALALQFEGLPLTTASWPELDALAEAHIPYSTVPDQNLVDASLARNSRHLTWRQHFRARLAVPKELPLRLALALRHGLGLDPRSRETALGEAFRIRVARGCASECSYCAIRKASGWVVSKPLADIVAELEAGLAAGHKLFHLIGEDVGAYGQDLGLTVVDLLDAMLDRSDDMQIAWDDFGTRWLIHNFPGLLRIFETYGDKIAHAGFPIQSGSDRVLERMRRGYTATSAERHLRALRQAAPGTWLTTHVIIGFPGETREDFLRTFDIVRKIGFDRVLPYVYSERTGTPAADLDGALSYPTKALRAWEFRLRLRLAAEGASSQRASSSPIASGG